MKILKVFAIASSSSLAMSVGSFIDEIETDKLGLRHSNMLIEKVSFDGSGSEQFDVEIFHGVLPNEAETVH